MSTDNVDHIMTDRPLSMSTDAAIHSEETEMSTQGVVQDKQCPTSKEVENKQLPATLKIPTSQTLPGMITRGTESCEENPLERIDIQPFLRRILEDHYSLKECRRHKNRFCVFFAHLLKEITTISRHNRMDLYSSWWSEELASLELLLYEALHTVDENFQLCFDIAYNAEFFIVNLLPKDESIMFFESMVNAAKRHSKLQFGIMLSSLGQVLRVTEAYDLYMKALDVLVPLGDSRDLAWLYNHIGCVWFDKGINKQSERYFKIAQEMLHRESRRLNDFGNLPRLKQCVNCPAPSSGQCVNCNRRSGTNDSTPWLRQEQILTDKTLASVLSCLGLMYSTNGNLKLAIECHEEALNIRRKHFGLHPSLGQGYNNLCLAYERIHDSKKAQECARKGLTIKKMLVTHNSNTILVSLLNMAHMTFRYDGNATRALSMLDEAYGIRAELGLKHHLTAVIHMYRGNMQLNLERFDQAEKSFANAVTILQQEKGLRPRQMAEALRKWGVALKNLGRLEEAEHRLSKSLKIIEKIVEDNDIPCEDEQNLKYTLRELRDVNMRINEMGNRSGAEGHLFANDDLMSSISI